MSKKVHVSTQARHDLRRLDSAVAARIVRALEEYANTGHGDVKHLKGKGREMRLRVGDWRIRFTMDSETIHVVRILHRSEAYE